MIAPLFSGWLQVCNAKRRARPLTRCQWCWAVRLVPAGCSCPGNRAAWQAHPGRLPAPSAEDEQ